MFREYSLHLAFTTNEPFCSNLDSSLRQCITKNRYSKSYSCLCHRKGWVTYRQLRARRALILFSNIPLRTRMALYHHRLDTVISPFSFSTEHLSIALTPFSLSTDDITVLCMFMYVSIFHVAVLFNPLHSSLVSIPGVPKKVECLIFLWYSKILLLFFVVFH